MARLGRPMSRNRQHGAVNKLHQRLVLALALALSILVGCASSETPVPPAPPALTPVNTSIVPTSTTTVTAIVTVMPTATDIPPAPTTTALPSPTIWLSSPQAATPILNLKLGVLGDSLSDEYRADDNRAGASYDGKYAATTLNWLELLVRHRGVNAGRWGNWGEPRRSGYQFNWARSGATVGEVISTGQLEGLAEQVRQGEVNAVIIMIGANDFALWNGTFAAIYNNPVDGGLTDIQLRKKVNDMVADFTTIIDTIQAAGNVPLMVSNLQDRGMDPYFQAQFPDSSRRQRATDAVATINASLQALSVSRGFYLIDRYNLITDNPYISRIDAQGFLHLDGQLIDSINVDDEPHHAMLADHEHIGTVGNGLMVNLLFIKALNSFGAGIAPFTDDEIIAYAGLTSVDTSETAP